MIKAIISDQIDDDPDIAFPIIAKAGIKYVELHNINQKTIETLNEQEVLKLQAQLKQYHLKVINLATTIFFMCPLKPDYQISLFNPGFHCISGNADEHLKALEQACKIAIKLDCQTIRVFPFRYPDNDKYQIVGDVDDMELIAEKLKQACAIASKYQRTLVLENCPYSHCPKGEMTYTLWKMVNCDNLKLLWDPANSYRAQKDQVPPHYLSKNLTQERELIKDAIGHVHLKNYHYDKNFDKPFLHTALNEGDIDFKALIKGINNPLSLEAEVDLDKTIASLTYLKEFL